VSEIVIYGFLGSPFGGSAQLCLEERGVPYRMDAFRLGAHRNDDHLARNPFARVPAIDHGDYRLYETRAQTCIAEFDRLIGNQAYFIGEHLSLADLMLAPQLDFFYGTREGRELLEGTALAQWLKRMNERPSMQRTQRPEPLRAAALTLG
jgi:glutathione S-transferase